MITALRIWWWRFRYGWRIWTRSSSDDVMFGHYWRMCFGQIAEAGWQYAVESEGGVEAALKESPVDWADEELSCWTD